MDIKITTENNKSTVCLSGEMTVYSAPELLQKMQPLLDRPEEIHIDMEAVESCDTAAYQVLLASELSARNAGLTFKVDRWSKTIEEKCRLWGIGPDLGASVNDQEVKS